MGDQINDYADVIDTLFATFSGVIEKDVISAIVESFKGDLNQSANALMNISGDINPVSFNSPRPIYSDVPKHFTYVNTPCLQHNAQGSMSYANVSQKNMDVNTNDNPIKKPSVPQLKKNNTNTYLTDEIREAIANYNKGWRLLILMRGLPGSGKSFLSREILQLTVGNVKDNRTFILSTDDYFHIGGVYKHDKSRLSDAHAWNQRRAQKAMMDGISPVIIDNTNIEIWEMQIYVKFGVSNGYIVTVVEPQTPWARKLNQLWKKNVHNVPYHTIQRMLNNYQEGITGEKLVASCGTQYPFHLTPPVLRNYPPLLPNMQNDMSKIESTLSAQNISPVEVIDGTISSSSGTHLEKDKHKIQNVPSDSNNTALHNDHIELENVTDLIPNTKSHHVRNKEVMQVSDEIPSSSNVLTVNPEKNPGDNNDAIMGLEEVPRCCNDLKECLERNQEDDNPKTMEIVQDDKDLKVDEQMTTSDKNSKFAEAEEYILHFKEVEEAWDNGDTWEENGQRRTTTVSSQPLQETIKPQRSKEFSAKELLIPIDFGEDWSKLSSFPKFNEKIPKSTREKSEDINKTSSSTCTESSDTDIFNEKLKIIKNMERCSPVQSTTEMEPALDTNISIVYNEKIPDQRTFDKSTSTANNDELIVKLKKCPNEDKHFKAFRKLFKNIPSESLKEIFEKCHGDVNWAVEIILEDIANKDNKYNEEQLLSDEDDAIDTGDQCDCLSKYNIIPDSRPVQIDVIVPKLESPVEEIKVPLVSVKKSRKAMALSDVSLQLKRQIERNVVISENFYSQHCLKIRNSRHGEPNPRIDEVGNDDDKEYKEDPSETGTTTEKPVNQETSDVNMPSTSKWQSEDIRTEFRCANDDENSISSENVEKTVNVTIGKEFIAQLDKLFGREDLTYPDNVQPIANVPLSLLNELNALWMESLTHQLEEGNKQTEEMIQQDADLARDLALKEEQFLLEGRQSVLPDFQEIMDLDYALSIYHKDIDAQRHNEPLNLAAKLTRDKLFNLFPEIHPDTLSEILMAHHDEFRATVEALLISMGRQDILEEENGVGKFIMKKDLENKQKYLEEKQRAMSDVEWPILPTNTKLGMEDVNNFRAEAARQMKLRQKNYEKAHEYMRRGMLSAASFYSSAGAIHTRLFEHANNKAAVTLAEVNARRCKNNATLDLHNYRVCESVESMDVFLDIHIQKLRQMNNRTSVKGYTLYIITGRGLHSPNGPRIKPACKARLQERGLTFYEMNPGLLAAKVNGNCKLSDEIA